MKNSVHKIFIHKNLQGLGKFHLLCKTKFFLFALFCLNILIIKILKKKK